MCCAELSDFYYLVWSAPSLSEMNFVQSCLEHNSYASSVDFINLTVITAIAFCWGGT